MSEKYNKYIVVFIIMNLLILLFSIIFFGRDGFFGEYFTKLYFMREDRFADFYNPAIYASDKQLVDNFFTNSPPFLHFCGFIFSFLINKIVPDGLTRGLEFMTSFSGYLIWFIIVFFASIIFCLQFKKLIKIKWAFFVGILVIIFSYPFIYTIDRGNYVLFAALFINLFIISYENNSKFSPLWLGLAAALKMYPALLGIIYIRDKRWKDAILSALVFFVLTIFSLLFFSRGDYSFSETLIDWLTKVKSYSTIGNGFYVGLINNCSLKSLFLCFSYFIFKPESLNSLVNSISVLSFSINILFVLLFFRILFLKNNHDIYLIATLIMVVFPVESGIYNLCLLLIPMLYWLYRENDKYIMLYSLIVFASKICVSLINPIFIILIIVRILLLRKCEVVNLKESLHEFRFLQKQKNINYR